MHMTRHNRPGFTLIEILVTLLIVSSGLLGFAALLNKSIVSNRHAYLVRSFPLTPGGTTPMMPPYPIPPGGGIHRGRPCSHPRPMRSVV